LDALNQKLSFIEDCLRQGQHDVAVKECGTLFEIAIRELLRNAMRSLPFARRAQLLEKEREIGRGAKGADSFGFGELVGMLRETGLVKEWATICVESLGSSKE